MENDREIPILKDTYKKLEEIAAKYNLDVQDLSTLAFNHIFDLIQGDPFIFLDSIGLINELKMIVT